jgi:hypothetical protein
MGNASTTLVSMPSSLASASGQEMSPIASQGPSLLSCHVSATNACMSGVEDDGYPRGLTGSDLEQSLTTLKAMAAEVHAACTLVKMLPGSNMRSCAVVRVHRICRDEVSYTDLRIAGELLQYSCSPMVFPGSSWHAPE